MVYGHHAVSSYQAVMHNNLFIHLIWLMRL